jgi:hypothetical protein
MTIIIWEMLYEASKQGTAPKHVHVSKKVVGINFCHLEAFYMFIEVEWESFPLSFRDSRSKSLLELRLFSFMTFVVFLSPILQCQSTSSWLKPIPSTAFIVCHPANVLLSKVTKANKLRRLSRPIERPPFIGEFDANFCG